MWFDLPQFFWANRTQPKQSVRLSTPAQFVEPWEFFFLGCDDDLSANPVGNSMLRAELHHLRGARDTEAGLERTGFVVNAGVNDSAVVSTLVAGNTIFLFKHQQALMREAAGYFKRDSQTDGPTSDDNYVVSRVDHAGGTRVSVAAQILVYDERHQHALPGIGRRLEGLPVTNIGCDIPR